MELFLLYLWLKLDGIILGAFMGAVACVAVLVCLLLHRSDCRDEPRRHAKIPSITRRIRQCFVIGVTLAVLSVMMPTSRDVAVLVGASYALDLARSPEGAKIQQLLRGKANEILDEQLKALKK